MDEKTLEQLETVVSAALDKALKNQFPVDPNAFMDRAMTARYADVTVRFLENRAIKGGGPPFVRVSAKCVKYRKKDVDAWADSLLVGSTSEATT